MTKPAAFAATYADWKLIRTRKCIQVVFEVPLEAANEAHAALGGMPNPAAEAWFAIARLDVSKVQQTEEEPEQSTKANPQPASATLPGRAPDRKLSQLAGMLSKAPLFHRYMEDDKILAATNVNEEIAANYIRVFCHVKSRSEIVANTPAAEAFLKLYDDFIRWRDADQYVEAS